MELFKGDSKANCKGLDANIFFPRFEEYAREAKEICAACSVREECLEFALTTRQQDGVWGGTSERERRRLLRQRRIAEKMIKTAAESA